MRAVASMAWRLPAYKPIFVPSIIRALFAESPSSENLIITLLVAFVVAGQRPVYAVLQAPRIRIGRLRQRRPVGNQKSGGQKKDGNR
jgi:hypothetical protein